MSVKAWVSSSSHVHCFCQGEGKRPHEILDLACGLPVVLKETKNQWCRLGQYFAIGHRRSQGEGLILGFQASEEENIEEPG